MLRSLRMLLLLCLVFSLSLFSRAQAQEPITVVPSQTAVHAKSINETEAQVLKLLEQRIRVSFLSTPLVEIVDYLREKTKIDIVIDRQALGEVELSEHSKITVNLEKVRLKTALSLMLRELDLTWVVYRGQLSITSFEDAESKLANSFYAVSDLGKMDDENKPDLEPLTELISTIIETDSWEELGGPGVITRVEQGIAISHSHSIHDQVAALLSTLRKVQHLPNTKYDVTPRNSVSDEEESNSQAVHKKLIRVVKNVQFIDAKLREVLDYLLEGRKLDFHIDSRALDDIGFYADDQKFSGLWKRASVESILYTMLQEHDLTFLFYDDVLLITTEDEAESLLITKVYPIRDFTQRDILGNTLLDWNARAPGLSGKYESIMEVITRIVEPESWEELGGPGAMTELARADCLVVSQTNEVHQKIDNFLTKVRQSRNRQPLDQAWLVDTDQHVVHMYTLPGLYSQQNSLESAEIQKSLEQLLILIKSEVEPEGWKGDKNTIRIIGDRLAIRQVRANHLKIIELLSKLGLLNSQEPSIGYGGALRTHLPGDSQSPNEKMTEGK